MGDHNTIRFVSRLHPHPHPAPCIVASPADGRTQTLSSTHQHQHNTGYEYSGAHAVGRMGPWVDARGCSAVASLWRPLPPETFSARTASSEVTIGVGDSKPGAGGGYARCLPFTLGLGRPIRSVLLGHFLIYVMW